ncbi:sensor histidine kinase [Niameybacter massiliensis]|uniref:sensor histidine kinase n=1 Tax=Niameybacter massiliensis TaxID=1658108 RepID=UPI0006B5904C|nr:sensor histidine kinase [Niameybacter massiliensis]
MNLAKYRMKTSIKTKWTIFVLILVIYPTILIGYVGYKNYEEVITKHFINSVQKDVLVTSDWFEEKLHDIEKFLTDTQYDEAIYDFMQYYYGRLKMAGIDPKDHTPENIEKIDKMLMNDYNMKEEKVGKYLKSLVLSRQDITLAAYQFREQNQFSYMEFRDEFRDRSKANYERDQFNKYNVFNKINQKLEDEDLNKTYYIDELNNIYFAQKLFYRDTYEHTGTIVIKLDKKQLMHKYEELLEGAKEAIYIQANKGSELVAIGNLTEKKKFKLNDFMEMQPEKDIVYKEENKKEAIIYNLFSTQNLTVGTAVYISTDILLEEIRALSRFMFMLCISTLPIFLLVANKLYKELIYPVYLLSDKMQQIEKGEMGVQIKGDYQDEIGYVYSSFNRMSKQIQYLVNCVYREQIILKSSELKALQSQINPHFLYNTLEMINWKARMSGNDDIAQMIEALSGIMEVNIDRRDSHYLTLQEEIEYLKNYIFLIQKRFGERIQFETKVPEHLLDYNIPRLVLQPLIENAISHGIEPVGEGIISIEVVDNEEELTIFIKDTGAGIEATRLAYLQHELNNSQKVFIESESEEKGKGRNHIGVINVQKRIKLLYGEGYGINIESEEGKGTAIIMKLPKTSSETL